MLEYDPPALTFRPGGDEGNVEVQMFDATAMQEQAEMDMGTLGLTDTRAPSDIDHALLAYHQHIALPRFFKHWQLSEYLDDFIPGLLQRLREAELLRDETPQTEHARLTQRLNQQQSRLDVLYNEVSRLNAELERLRVPQQPRNQHLSIEERMRGAQYAAYQMRGSSRRAPSLDGSIRSGEDNGLPVSAEVLYEAVCRSLYEGRARRAPSLDGSIRSWEDNGLTVSTPLTPLSPGEWYS